MTDTLEAGTKAMGGDFSISRRIDRIACFAGPAAGLVLALFHLDLGLSCFGALVEVGLVLTVLAVIVWCLGRALSGSRALVAGLLPD